MLILNVFFVGMQLTIIFVIVKSDDYFLIKYFVYKMSKNSQYDRYNFQELSWLSCFGQQSLTLLLTLSYEEKCPSLMAEFTTLISLMSSCDWPLQPSAAVTYGCVSPKAEMHFPHSNEWEHWHFRRTAWFGLITALRRLIQLHNISVSDKVSFKTKQT